MSTLSELEGKSLMCPKLDFTVKPLPRNFSIVLAFAGDSTITKFSPITSLIILDGHKVRYKIR